MPGWVPGPWRGRRGGHSVARVRSRLALVSSAVWRRLGGWSGQTSAEYLGVLLVIAAIITALLLTDPGQAIGDKLSDIVRDIAGDR
jgi:hypothetical protein